MPSTSALRVLVQWCAERGLSVNMDKTHTMLIHPKETPSAQMEVSLNRHTLTQVLSTRFLSLIIDDVLSWTEHMNALSRKVAQKTGALWCCGHSLDLSPRRLYYITVIQRMHAYKSNTFYLLSLPSRISISIVSVSTIVPHTSSHTQRGSTHQDLLLPKCRRPIFSWKPGLADTASRTPPTASSD